MPKMTQNQIAVRIPLSQIVETGNVRTEYDDIAYLASSILKNGLFQPVVVKRAEIDENGLQQYELVAGHRRMRAFKWLCEKGHDYTSIDAVIKTGDKEVMQLIENIQRSDLTVTEKENALKKMIAAGYSQKQIAEELCKPLSWVSDILKGSEVRQIVAAAGVNTDGIATKTLSQIRSIPKDELPAVVEQIKENGGTVRAATEILHRYRKEMPEQMPQNGLVKKVTAEKGENTTAVSSECFAFFDVNNGLPRWNDKDLYLLYGVIGLYDNGFDYFDVRRLLPLEEARRYKKNLQEKYPDISWCIRNIDFKVVE